MPAEATGWSAVVPVRDFRTGKSRLRAEIPGELATEIARGLALNVLRALLRSERLDRILVVSDVDLRSRLRLEGVEFLTQRPGGGLNGAVLEGIETLGRRPALVIHADLPRADPRAIRELLDRADGFGDDAFLPDREGTGTTLLLRRAESSRAVAFGSGSAGRHAGLGYAPMELPPDHALRNDLDTVADAVRALRRPIAVAR